MAAQVLRSRTRLVGVVMCILLVVGAGCDGDRSSKSVACPTNDVVTRTHPNETQLRAVLAQNDSVVCSQLRENGAAALSVVVSFSRLLDSAEIAQLVERHSLHPTAIESAHIGADWGRMDIGSRTFAATLEADRVRFLADLRDRSDFIAELRSQPANGNAIAVNDGEVLRLQQELELAKGGQYPKYIALHASIPVAQVQNLLSDADIRYVVEASLMGGSPKGIHPVTGEWR